jgi:hypothetical protein
MPQQAHVTHIRFVDSFVRNRHLKVMLLCFVPMAAVFVFIGLNADVDGLTRTQLQLILAGSVVFLVFVVHLIERWKRPVYGLYILPDALQVRFQKHYRLDLQLNFHGVPVVVIRKVGKQYELTSATQRRAMYVPVAAIPSLPKLLLHYKLDVKLIESAQTS